ncbi:MAG: dUTP diphosphatase [Planctomycetota bacterium]
MNPSDAPTLRIKLLDPRAAVPAYQSSGAAGMDLAALLPDGPITLGVGGAAIIPTGLAMAIPPGFEGQVRPRSGLAGKLGVMVPNAPGTIDSDYRGEVRVPLRNLGENSIEIEHGMRIAQIVIAPVMQAKVVTVDELDDTARGAGGFGSTGFAAPVTG